MVSSRPRDPAGTLELFRTSGIVGTASGIPLHRRLSPPTPVLLVHAVEGEPTYTVLTLLMERNARELAEGMGALAGLGFRRVVLAVSEWTAEESDTLLRRADEAGFEVAEVPGDYREIDEAGIVRAALHRPAEAGMAGVTVVGLETVLHAHRALFKGRPMTSKLVQMAGDLEVAAVLEVPLGADPVELALLAGAPEGARAYPMGAAERARGKLVVPANPRPAVDKTTDTIVVVDPELPGPPDLGLETMTPAERIEEVTDRLGRLRLTLGPDLHPAVRVGDRVRRGQTVAVSREDGADLHAPIDGTVAEAQAGAIVLAR